jgi:hypothetical protein
MRDNGFDDAKKPNFLSRFSDIEALPDGAQKWLNATSWCNEKRLRRCAWRSYEEFVRRFDACFPGKFCMPRFAFGCLESPGMFLAAISLTDARKKYIES